MNSYIRLLEDSRSVAYKAAPKEISVMLQKINRQESDLLGSYRSMKLQDIYGLDLNADNRAIRRKLYFIIDHLLWRENLIFEECVKTQ